MVDSPIPKFIIGIAPSQLNALSAGEVLSVKFEDFTVELRPIREPVPKAHIRWFYARSVVIEWPPEKHQENVAIVRKYLAGGARFMPYPYEAPTGPPMLLDDPNVIVRVETFAFCGWTEKEAEGRPTYNNPLREPVQRYSPHMNRKSHK